MLHLSDLRTSFFTPEGEVKAVDGVSFSLEKGITLCLVGESGCGKTVTALSVMGLIPSPPGKIVGGSIRFDQRELAGLNDEEMRSIRGARIGMIFQEPMTSLNPVFTVGFQIAEALLVHKRCPDKKTALDKAADLMDQVGIPDSRGKIKAYPNELSGGMRQRVMIAMAISCQPDLLIADEPTTALDVTIQAQILALLNRLKQDRGMSTIFITHDLGVVAEMADEVAVMYAGKIVERAPAMALFDAPSHPYTVGLLESLPRLRDMTQSRQPLKAIPGGLPDMRRLPIGCRFADRCTLAEERCRLQPQALQPRKADQPTHQVACWKRST